MSLKEELVKQIKENRPKLSDKSIASYVSTLINIPKKYGNGDGNVNVKWYDDNSGHILKELKDVPATKRKSILSAIFILTNNKDIHADMITDAKCVNEQYKQQKKSVNEKENWIDWTDVVGKYNEMLKQSNLIMKKKLISQEDFFELNKFVLLSCYVLFPPRRSLDYALMKTKGYNKETDNYVEKASWTFNQYKTFKVYGRQTFPINKELQSIFRKWSKINETDYLVVNTNMKPLNSSGITKLLNSIFDDRNISVDMLRHSYLTHTYDGKMPSLVEMENLAKMMAHSVSTAMTYIKHD